MKYRWQILIGFAVVILPPLISALWTIHSSRKIDNRIAALNDPLFEIVMLTNQIAFLLDDLQDAFSEVGFHPSEEGIARCEEMVAELDTAFIRLRGLASDRKVVTLHGIAMDYTETGMALLASGNTRDIFNRGGRLSKSAEELKQGVVDLREAITREFAVSMNKVRGEAEKTRAVTWTTSLLAFLFGTLLALILAHRFGLQDDALRRANEELATRYDELYRTNDLLEKQVAERKRAEQALRLSLSYEEALAEVSELFTATFSPNLRKAIEILGQAVGSDLAFLVVNASDGRDIEQRLVWSALGVRDKNETLEPDIRGYMAWYAALSRNENLVLEEIGEPPPDVLPEEAVAHQAGIRSLLVVPITSEEETFRGYMGVATLESVKRWSKEDIRILRVATEILANYLARKRAEERLKHDAFHDGLTGLANRSLFMDRLAHVLDRADRYPEDLFAVLFLDLDRFKPINDSLGHLTGDQLLVQVAQRLEECVRNLDTVARLGGDEFTVLLEEVKTPEEVEEIAKRINLHLAKPFDLGNNTVHTSASIGITLCRGNYNRPEDILRDADIAMYQAKTQGKARFVIFDADSHGHSTTILKMESDLRRALDRGELMLHYQPIVSLEDGTISGFEALLRWYHQGRDYISPSRFIPLAEDSGLIRPIGRWVLRESCQQLERWKKAGFDHLTISVNVSPRQFYERNLGSYIRQVCNEVGILPSMLNVEITESLLMENVGMNITMLAQLQEMGVRVSIDDFGTGYSSLAYLKRFPLHTLKIDRTFIRDVPADPENKAITSAIVAMALSLNLEVIAEGVETLAQHDFLKTRGCQKFQGYLFSKPLCEEEATDLLKRHEAVTTAPSAVSGSRVEPRA